MNEQQKVFSPEDPEHTHGTCGEREAGCGPEPEHREGPHDAHDHGHTHEHDHSTCGDSNCGCHDHEHTHDHDHHSCTDPNCECHDHDHGHTHDHGNDMCDDPIQVSRHAPAVVGSVQCAVPLPCAEAVREVEARMDAVANAVEAGGGFIGHIKSIVTETGRRCRISITDEREADKQFFDGGAPSEADCVFIVFGVEPEALRGHIRDAFDGLL